MGSQKVEITIEGGKVVKVKPHVCNVNSGAGDTVKWEIKADVANTYLVEIVVYAQHGTLGPFRRDNAKLTNPTRGWYHSAGGRHQTSYVDLPIPAPTMWKYDVVLYDCDSGQEIDRFDPWLKLT